MPELTIQNYKVSVRLQSNPIWVKRLREIQLDQKSNPNPEWSIGKKGQSFFVLRAKRFVFVIFKNGHVNCSGIRTNDELPICLSVLNEIVNTKEDLSPFLTTDNITASSNLQGRIVLIDFCHFLKSKGEKIHYNSERFPGACFRTSNKACILIFDSGKIILTGVKKETQLRNEFEQFLKLYHEFFNLLPRSQASCNLPKGRR